MTKRTPITAEQNIWFDAQQVDNTDLSLEQDYNSVVTSGIINNHIGNGVLPEVLIQNILFDSALVSGFLDGIAISAQNQPNDNNLGNQLEINLSESKASGKKAVKIAIIGLDFENNLQYETFYFKTNESQITKKHYTKILVLLFNDFIGNSDLSLNLGGRVTILEARPMTLSRDGVMVSQEVEPNLFFRDFFLDGFLSLETLLQNALPYYNISALNIFTSGQDEKVLLSEDVTTQIGQKFLATTNNIQKVTLLMSVRNLIIGQENDLVWNGDLVVSIYPLQSNINCSTDIVPNLPIDFPPFNIPVAQLSFNYASLQAIGTILDSVPQPVDFVFSNSPVAGGNVLIPGNYYALTIKRSGAANKCDILLTSGSNQVQNSRITTFTGTLWVDLPDEDLWFKIWTDSAKISDGQAYDTGHGMAIGKTITDSASQATIDRSVIGLPFVGNDVFRAVVSASVSKTTPIPDQRTGQPVLSRKQFIPNIQLLNSIDVSNLQNTAEPLIIGAIVDKNRKYFDSISSQIISKLYSSTIVNDEIFIKIITDPTDNGRYDESVKELVSHLLLGDLINAKIIPNNNDTSIYYRIADAKLCSMIVGDVDGDGLITENDAVLLNSYLNYDLNLGLPTDTIVYTDNVTTTFLNGYSLYTNKFSNLFGINFQLVDVTNNTVVASGSDGVLIANPANPRLAQFTSATVAFNTIVGMGNYKLVLLTPTVKENFGGFDIIGLDNLTDVLTIRKVYLTSDVMGQLLRADVDGDFYVSGNDGYLLQNYIERQPYVTSGTTTYPAPATAPYTKIGTRFNVVKLKVEKFTDRNDDYSSLILGRPTVVHPVQDIFLNDGYFDQHNFYNSPSYLFIEKQLTWEDYLIVTNSKPRLVPSVLTSNSGFEKHDCQLEGILCNVYGSKPNFDPGLINYFVPDNLILGEGGELQRPDGNFYKVDFEVGTIVLEIPDGLFGSEKTINIMDDFIASTSDPDTSLLTGVTKLGFPAMKFADCSLVTPDALSKDQLRFSVSVQSFSPNTSGLSSDGYSGAIVDGKMGVNIDYATGLLTLNFTNLYQDTVLSTLSTKIQINVFLKKGGFNNRPVFIDSTKVQNMLKLISVFSGAVDGGPSALVDLENDVSGILPIVHGGTGLNSTGAFGTVLTSTGSGLSYQFIYDLVGVIPFSTGAADANRIPKTDGHGLLDPSFSYKNPVYIYGTAGVFSNDTISPIVIGAFPFRFDKFILQGLDSIKLEVILETTNVTKEAQIQLYSISTATYINLVGLSTVLGTTNTSATFLVSDDIKTLLSAGASDFVYEIHLGLSLSGGTDLAICKMARLVLTYNNPYAAAPPVAHSWNFVPYLPSPNPI